MKYKNTYNPIKLTNKLNILHINYAINISL